MTAVHLPRASCGFLLLLLLPANVQATSLDTERSTLIRSVVVDEQGSVKPDWPASMLEVEQSQAAAAAVAAMVRRGSSDGEFASGLSSTGKYEPGSVGKAAANMLLGVLVLVMVVYYMVNGSHPDIVAGTWSTLGNAISIFTALLIFKCIQDFSSFVFNWEETAGEEAESGNVPVGQQIIIVFRFIFAFVVIELCLLRYREKKVPLAAWGLLGANLVGFMGGDAFAVIQMQTPFKESVAMSFCAVFIAAITIGLMIFFGARARDWYTKADGSVDDSERAFEYQCRATENTFFTFALGLVITQTIRHAICGKPRDFHGPQYNNNIGEIYALFGVAVVWLIGVVVFDMIGRCCAAGTMQRIRVICEELCAMTMGWCLLFFGKWWFWYTFRDEVVEGDILTGQMYMAVGCSLGSFIVISLFGVVGNKFPAWSEAMGALVQALEMVIGLAWASVFVSAIESASRAHYDSRGSRVLHDVTINTFLCILIIPAWYWHILPRNLDESGHLKLTETLKEVGEKANADNAAMPLAAAAAPIGGGAATAEGKR